MLKNFQCIDVGVDPNDLSVGEHSLHASDGADGLKYWTPWFPRSQLGGCWRQIEPSLASELSWCELNTCSGLASSDGRGHWLSWQLVWERSFFNKFCFKLYFGENILARINAQFQSNPVGTDREEGLIWEHDRLKWAVVQRGQLNFWLKRNRLIWKVSELIISIRS